MPSFRDPRDEVEADVEPEEQVAASEAATVQQLKPGDIVARAHNDPETAHFHYYLMRLTKKARVLSKGKKDGYQKIFSTGELVVEGNLLEPDTLDCMGADSYTVGEFNFSEFPIIIVNLTGNLPERTLMQVANQLQDRLEGLEPVLEVTLAGNRDEMVEVTPEAIRIRKRVLQANKRQYKSNPITQTYIIILG